MRLINTSNSACPLHKLCFGSPPLSIDFIVILEKLGTHSQHFSETLSNGLFLSSASLLHTHSVLHFSANLERLGRKWYSSFITDLLVSPLRQIMTLLDDLERIIIQLLFFQPMTTSLYHQLKLSSTLHLLLPQDPDTACNSSQ